MKINKCLFMLICTVCAFAWATAPAVAQRDVIAFGLSQGDDNGGVGVDVQSNGVLTNNFKTTGFGGNTNAIGWYSNGTEFTFLTDGTNQFGIQDLNGVVVKGNDGTGAPGLDLTVLSNDNVVWSLGGTSAQTRNPSLTGIVHGPALFGTGNIASTEMPNGVVPFLYGHGGQYRIRGALPGGDWNGQQDFFDNGFGAGEVATKLSSLPNGNLIIGHDDNGRISIRPPDGTGPHINGNLRGAGVGVTDVLGLPDGNMAVAFSNGDFNIYTGSSPIVSLGGGGGFNITSMAHNPVTNNLVYGTQSGDIWVRSLDDYSSLSVVANRNVSNSPIASIDVTNQIPEPTTGILALFASISLVGMRRRS